MIVGMTEQIMARAAMLLRDCNHELDCGNVKEAVACLREAEELISDLEKDRDFELKIAQGL